MRTKRHVIVTGGSSGIGAAVARLCADRGDDVSLIARTRSGLDAVLRELEAAHSGRGLRFYAQTADVRDDAAMMASVATCESALGPCATLVTSAGIVVPGRFDQLSADEFRAQIDTNLIGTANAVRAVLPGMIGRRGGQILMMGSGAGLMGIYGYAAYCASKFGLTGFAEALRQEGRTYGVTVSLCFPPDSETPQLAGELPLRPAAAAAIIGVAKPWKSRDVARVALDGLEAGRFAIYPGRQMALLGRSASLLAPILRRFADSRVRKAGRI